MVSYVGDVWGVHGRDLKTVTRERSKISYMGELTLIIGESEAC